MKLLEDLYRKQTKEVQTLDWIGEGQSMKTLSNIYSTARRAMGRVNFSFDTHADSVGSWIGGETLVLQMFTNSRMTVDLTLKQLERERPYDMPFESLCKMAEADLLYLNFRDYDSDKKAGFSGHKTDLVSSRVHKLFERASNRLYIGSAIRKPIFDTALKISGYENKTLDDLANAAEADLVESERCFREALATRDIEQDGFRGEDHSRIATATHWAYLNAIAHFLPPHLVGTPTSDLNVRFQRAAEAGAEAKRTKDVSKRRAAAVAFLDLARRLRSCHLNFTAPVTASWGTTYNMTSAEYQSAADIRDYWNDPSIQMKDSEISRYILYFLQEATDTAHLSFKSLGLGDFTLRERIDEHVLIDPVVAALIKIRVKNEAKIAEAAQILSEVKQDYLQAGITGEEGRLKQLLADFRAIESEKIGSYVKALETVWSYLIVPTAGALSALSHGIFPWLVPLAGDGIKAGIAPVVEKLWHRPPAQRGIHRVRRQLTTLRQ